MHGAPRYLPTVADAIYGLSEEEWEELGLAFAYGQRLPAREDLEDIREFREFYTALCNKYCPSQLALWNAVLDGIYYLPVWILYSGLPWH